MHIQLLNEAFDILRLHTHSIFHRNHMFFFFSIHDCCVMYCNIKRLFIFVIFISILSFLKEFWYLQQNIKVVPFKTHSRNKFKFDVKYANPQFSFNYENERRIVKRSIVEEWLTLQAELNLVLMFHFQIYPFSLHMQYINNPLQIFKEIES